MAGRHNRICRNEGTVAMIGTIPMVRKVGMIGMVGMKVRLVGSVITVGTEGKVETL